MQQYLYFRTFKGTVGNIIAIIPSMLTNYIISKAVQNFYIIVKGLSCSRNT